ncbi:MAG TPA: ABC transporter permease [Candidatus Krumholzibacteria bacterium]|nr:ABC transporter permease [Candidatus Krumholzibacteria bacterium]
MLRHVWFLGRKDVQYMLRERESIGWMFVMPIVFFYFIGTVTSNFGSRGGSQDRLALWSDGDTGFLGDQLQHRLEDRRYGITRPGTTAEFDAASRRLSIPSGFTDSVLAGKPVKLRFAREESGLGNDYDRVRIGRAAYTLLADVIVTGEQGLAPTPASIARLDSLPRTLQVETTPAGKLRRVPTGFEQAIPGILVMFVLSILCTSGAVLLFTERRQGLLRRLAYTPISRPAIVLGKWSGKMGIGVVQIAFGMLAGTVLFKMNWGPNFWMVVVLMLAYATLTATLGILLGSLARSEGQAVAIGVVATNVLAALGGCWWPIEITPKWMQKLQLFLPTGWAMDGMHQLVSFGAAPTAVLPHVLGMCVASVILFVLATRVFRFE